MTATAQNAAALESAFEAFIERSTLLEASYRELQDKVQGLTARLHESQTARHRELLEKERLGDRLGRTLEALPGAVVVLDADGIICDSNSSAVDLLKEPLLGRPWAEIVQREFNSSQATDGDLVLADGRILSLQRRRLGAGEGDILLLTDVSDSRRTAAMLARQERLSAIGEMTARLAHQIRTPLASALLYASQLTPGDSSATSASGRVVARLRELDGIINDMLRFAGGVRDDDQVIDISRLLDDVVETARAHFSGDLDISIGFEPANYRLCGNYGALKGALGNLVDNAAAACGADGAIELGAQAGDGRLSLTVTDNGPGMPDAVAARIFEPFFTTRPQGTGLGLPVVRSVAEAHGGDVLVQSGDAGTTIALCLPVSVSDTPVRALREACHG